MSSTFMGLMPPETHTNALSYSGIIFFTDFTERNAICSLSSSDFSSVLRLLGQQIRRKTYSSSSSDDDDDDDDDDEKK